MSEVEKALTVLQENAEKIADYYEANLVVLDNIYDLRAAGPERYGTYLKNNSNLVNLLREFIPEISRLKQCIDSLRQEVVEAVTDHLDANHQTRKSPPDYISLVTRPVKK